MNKLEFRVETKILEDEGIEQTVVSITDDYVHQISRTIADVKEHQLKSALIELGWIPPELKPCEHKNLNFDGPGVDCPDCGWRID